MHLGIGNDKKYHDRVTRHTFYMDITLINICEMKYWWLFRMIIAIGIRASFD